jgi:hypothetical protein
VAHKTANWSETVDEIFSFKAEASLVAKEVLSLAKNYESL